MKLFITSTGTNIGKTLVTCKLASQLKKTNIKILKPILSGWHDQNNDIYDILTALDKSYNQDNINKVNLYRFKAPISVDLAAKLENTAIDFDKIVDFCNSKSDVTIIEGAGGIMSPLSENYTNLDLIKVTGSNIILVVGNYLGTISHTLCAIEVMKYHNINLLKIIITECSNNDIDIDDNISILRKFTAIEIIKINKIDSQEKKWLYIDDLNF